MLKDSVFSECFDLAKAHFSECFDLNASLNWWPTQEFKEWKGNGAGSF